MKLDLAHRNACVAALAVCAFGPRPLGGQDAFVRGEAAFMGHDLPRAESAYREVLTSDTVSDHRVAALDRLAAIAWRIRKDTAAAGQLLARAEAEPVGRVAALLERARMLRAFGEFADARVVAIRARAAAANRLDREDSFIAFAAAVIEPRIRQRLGRRTGRAGPVAGEGAELRPTVLQLDSLVLQDPGDLEPARLLLLGASLIGDGPALLHGWRSYYLVYTGDSATGPLATPRRTLAAILPTFVGASSSLETRSMVVRALGASSLFEAAAALALQRTHAGTAIAERDPRASELVAYATFIDAVRRATDEFYRRTALGQPDTAVWHGKLRTLGAGLWPKLAWNHPAGLFRFGLLLTEVDRRFGATVGFGPTSGYANMHYGHRVVDERRVVHEYGHAADVRFVVLDGMVSNGFESWVWDGTASHGGWNVGPLIVQVRPRIAKGALLAWRALTDSVQRKTYDAQIAIDSASDFARARATPVAFFPSVAERIARDGSRELLDSLRLAGRTGKGLEASFKREYDRETFESLIIGHEGRHAIDRALRLSIDGEEREYRAKLSQVVFAPRPKLGLEGTIAGNMGDATPHGRANARVMRGLFEWLTVHQRGLPIDPAEPLLPQLPRLSNSQLRAAFASMDPLAKASGYPADVVSAPRPPERR